MLDNQYLILASQSPRRLSLLKNSGIIPDEVISADIDETQYKGEKSLEYIKRMSLEKAMKVKPFNNNSYIIAADTVIVKGVRVLGKPKDRDQARDFLELLSGCNHNVLTSFTVISPNKVITKVSKTKVTVKRLSYNEIIWYLDSNEWKDKSGGYAIQGIFEIFVKQINGSLSNIIGLPMMSLYNTLVGLGYKIKFSPLNDK